jgi:hypothetical protein
VHKNGMGDKPDQPLRQGITKVISLKDLELDS